MKHNVKNLPRWAQGLIRKLEEQVRLAEATIPWTKPGMEWFTLFHPDLRPKPGPATSLFDEDESPDLEMIKITTYDGTKLKLPIFHSHPIREPREDVEPIRIFTCGSGGTKLLVELGPDDFLFVGRGGKRDSFAPPYPIKQHSNVCGYTQGTGTIANEPASG